MANYLLIDGNSLTYRAFFALPTDIATASGQVTNAVYGFTSMLVNLLRDYKPDHVAVAFDLPQPTFRHEMVETYKATRQQAPDILRQQMGLVRQMVEAFKIPMLELPGYEADDIIATLATVLRDRGEDVLICTGDRDSYQLVEDPHIKVLYTASRGVSEVKLYDEAGIFERTGVKPSDYVQYAALRGDTSDNLPGVPGVGEKTAAKLINTYGGIDGIFENVDKQTPKLRANLAEHEAQVRQNVEMMRLVRDAPVDVEPESLHMGDIDPDEIRQLFAFLEFRSANLHERLAEVLGDRSTVTATPLETINPTVRFDAWTAPAAAVDLLRGLQAGSGLLAVAAAWRGDDGRSPLEAMAFVVDPAAGEVAWVPADVLADPAVVAELVTLFGPGGRPLAAHGAKALIRSLHLLGVDVRTLSLDTMIAAYLIEPADSRYVLAELLERFASARFAEDDADADVVPEGQLDFGGDGGSSHAKLAARDAWGVQVLLEPMSAALTARGLSPLFDDIEIPLVRVLAGMEAVGVAVDVEVLRELNKQMIDDCDRLTREIWKDAGEEFNVNSTPKLREILFDRLGLAPQKKTKTGYSTDASSLEKLIGLHPIIEHLLSYREVEKLRSTYGEGLLAAVDPHDGRIHATFNQTVARTGRLSSDQPNLHNIPVRSEGGRAFRKAFIPGEGFEFLIADYNQIELRCIAHLAEDPGLIAAFESGTDIHTETAARVFGVAHDAVTLEQRSKAKMVSYGLAYGMEAYGLGQRLSIPTSEAETILDAYFVAFPSVKAYMEATVAEARAKGYTETLFGRRRQIPELSSSNFRIRQAGERQAMNAGIQGLAADIFKVALVHLDEGLEAGGHRSRVVLQVHDEVIVELDPAERDVVTTLTLDAMSGAFDLRVPLAVNLSYGSSWAAAKG
jgi:DNA polymerase-1